MDPSSERVVTKPSVSLVVETHRRLAEEGANT